ncbi:MAG: hypothetical protein AMXMBFR64_49710 [Myxococcales bacterium]
MARVRSVQRALLLALLLSTVVAAAQSCKEEIVYDTIYLEIRSGVVVDELHVRVRSASDAGRTVIGATAALGTLVKVPSGRSLASDPFVIRVEPGSAVSGLVDLQVSGLAGGALVAAWGGRVDLTIEAAIPVNLTPLPAGCDADGDGAVGCDKGSCCPGSLAELADCDDTNAEVSPFAAALPECIPCAGALDWLCTGAAPPCADTDGDGVADCEDCAPSDKTVGPGLVEICGNGKDDNCDGQQDEGWTWNDAGTPRKVGDACGVGACAGGVVSCDNDLRVPVCTTAAKGTVEVCGNAIDDDCDGATDEGCTVGDWDGDGYVEGDCRPYDSAFHPGAFEPCCDKSLGDKALAICDRDCDGEVGLCSPDDKDADGFAPPADCDDGDATVHPGAPEKCDDGVDQDCDGRDTACGDPGVVDGDGDQWVVPGDCDDTNPAIHPLAAEVCDNKDNDCDGIVDEGNPGGGDPCEPSLEFGVCAPGTLVCAHLGSSGGTVGAKVTCVDYVAGQAELCNGLDDDCDGQADEGFDWDGAPVGAACEGTGACGLGTVECAMVEGTAVALCSTNPGGSASEAQPEVCDLADNDCDGVTDEGLTGGLLEGCLTAGVCAAGVPAACVEGQVECGYGEVPGFEDPEVTCDGKDNDCSGEADEPFTYGGAKVGAPCDGVGECGAGAVECAAGGASATCSTNPGASASQAKPEVCNAKDDDCDGETDEGFDYAGVALGGACDGVGECGTGTVECAPGGGKATCSTNPDGSGFVLVPEICNGKDDDCDGQTDEPFDYGGVALGAPCVGVGACGPGTVECVAGGLKATCSTNPDGSAPGATGEACNGKDDDCDGQTDEGYTWNGLGLGATCDGVGECGLGKVECRGDGAAATCSTNPDGSAPGDKPETCDGKDEDCSGAADDNLPTGEAAIAAAKCNTQGVCADPAIAPTCGSAKWACHYDKAAGWEVAEVSCDGLDNDCDGQTDEGFQWSGVGLGKACDGTGECGAGTVECTPDKKTATCSTNANGTQKQDTSEVCNGKDDDCDGQTDEGLPTGVAAVTAAGCKTAGVCVANLVQAVCTTGAWVCGYGAISDYEAGAELSCDGKDNDCDGFTDEEFTWLGLSKGTACDGTGECGQGVVVCDATGKAATCSTNPNASGGSQAKVEDCNGKDDDCDGVTDNNLPTGGAAIGAAKCNTKGVCASPQIAPTCTNGSWTCHYELATGYEGATEASCDGQDNDCDGATDEEFTWSGLVVGAVCDGVGECGVGVVQCKGVSSATCSTNPDGTSPGGAEESCNGKDDDCDGQTDETWTLGVPCDGPDADSCEEGVTICSADGTTTACSDATGDTVEVCNGLDDDCDGSTDEHWPNLKDVCDGVDDDFCDNGLITCTADGSGVTCVEDGPGEVEVCDGQDNDCDGQTDEGYAVGEPCSVPDELGDADSCSESGTWACDPALQTAVCSNVQLSAKVELCNGVDDTCDGSVDEAFPTKGQKCDGADGDSCATGTLQCSVDGTTLVCGGDVACAPGTSCFAGEGQALDVCLCGTAPCNVNQGDACAPATNDCTCGGLDDGCDGVVLVCKEGQCKVPE